MIFDRNDLPLVLEMSYYKNHPYAGEVIYYPLWGEDIYYNKVSEKVRKKAFY